MVLAMLMDLTALTIKQTHQLLKKKEISSTELTEAYLERIDKENKNLNAYLEVFNDAALAQAKAADEFIADGGEIRPLTGIPLAIKDNILIKGFRTAAGSKILENYQASYDASVIRRLRQAHSVFLGKTNLDEFAMGSSTERSAFGPTKNPRALDRVPGGSSGGSAAAVAADLCTAALGSDTGGSIRQPASFCGIVGLKPTYGRVSRSGLIAMASSLDQIGPMTKTVEDCAILFEAISGYDPHDATSHANPTTLFQLPTFNQDLNRLKIGFPKEYFGEGIDPKVREKVEDAIRKLNELGADIQEVSLPHSKYALACYYLIMPAEVSANLARFDGIRYGYSILRNQSADLSINQSSNLWEVYFQSRQNGFGDEVRRRIMLGTYALSAGYYEAYYLKAQKVRSIIKKDFDQVFKKVDILATPTSPILPFKFGEKLEDPLSMYLADIYTVSINLAGLPALSMPCGEVDSLPVGLQLIGKPFGEKEIFEAAVALEQALQYANQH